MPLWNRRVHGDLGERGKKSENLGKKSNPKRDTANRRTQTGSKTVNGLNPGVSVVSPNRF